MSHAWIMLNVQTGQRKAVSDCIRLMMPAQWITEYRSDCREGSRTCEHGHPRCAVDSAPFNYCGDEHQ
jgi:hypothetical protein